MAFERVSTAQVDGKTKSKRTNSETQQNESIGVNHGFRVVQEVERPALGNWVNVDPRYLNP